MPDAGERAAIALAIAVRAEALLMDEYDGRAEAKHRRLPVTGTLGVLSTAHLAGLLDFETALAQLRRTNFYVTDAIIDGLRQRLVRAKDATGDDSVMIQQRSQSLDEMLPESFG